MPYFNFQDEKAMLQYVVGNDNQNGVGICGAARPEVTADSDAACAAE